MRPEIIREIGPATQEEHQDPPQEETWWAGYERAGLGSLSETARKVVQADSRRIAEKLIRGPTDKQAWPATRVRTGVIVGAVQSGKTASMLGVSAYLLDSGIDILIVLAGTSIALWRQTYERLLEQLDCSTVESARNRRHTRLLIPSPHALLRAIERPSATEYLSAERARFASALREERPVIAVIAKQDDHLLAMARFLEEQFGRYGTPKRDLHMVVLDDEADDGSILDSQKNKILPRRIQMLWTGRSGPETLHDFLYTTYVAYTATPQANFLQHAENALSPRSFCAALRVPYKTGEILAPQPTFKEPLGIHSYYCGGEFFHVELAESSARPCRTLAFPRRRSQESDIEHGLRVRRASDELVLRGLRAYLVAAAISHYEGAKRGVMTITEAFGGFSHEELGRLPQPSCMLIHPSARQALHASEARRLVLLSAGTDPDSLDAPESPRLRINVESLKSQIAADDEEWRACLADYRKTAEALALVPGGATLAVPADGEWHQLRDTLFDQVLPHVRIRIINSSPDTDDRPRFAPELRDETWYAAPDLLTIFVSGNVMSRGITIEGLCTSVFTRPAFEPAADTQMQMQRWFGYRGARAHLCRLFCFEDQARLFRMYHEHDVSMRREILDSSIENGDTVSSLILQGPRSLATAKVPTARLPLHPGPTPSCRLLEAEDAECAGQNATLLSRVLENGAWKELVAPPTHVRGLIRTQPASLLEVADLLDRFRYSNHDPSEDYDERYTRWRALESRLGLVAAERPLFRPPGIRPGEPLVDVQQCPYSIAAYLRLWTAALKRSRCDGLYPSDAEGMPWSLAQLSLEAPEIYIGVRFGEEGLSHWPKLAARRILTMKRKQDQGPPRMLATVWGTRQQTAGYNGDPLFDYHYHANTPPRLLGDGPLWRPRGHPGLLLFHVVRREPDERGLDGVTFGLSLPHGGPEQFASLRM